MAWGVGRVRRDCCGGERSVLERVSGRGGELRWRCFAVDAAVSFMLLPSCRRYGLPFRVSTSSGPHRGASLNCHRKRRWAFYIVNDEDSPSGALPRGVYEFLT